MKINFIKNKLTLVSISLMATATNAMSAAGLGGVIGATDGNSNLVQTVLGGSPIVSAVVKSALVFGILYSVFKIAQELLDGQGGGQGGKMWGKFGAIIGFGVIYYFLFVLTGTGSVT